MSDAYARIDDAIKSVLNANALKSIGCATILGKCLNIQNRALGWGLSFWC